MKEMKARKKGLFFLLFLFSVPLLTAQTGFSSPLVLEEAIRMALAKNEQILDSEASLEIAQLNLRRAEKLFTYPQLNLSFDPWWGKYDIEAEDSQSSAQLAMSGTVKFRQGTDIGLNYQGIYDYESQGYNDSYSLELHQSLFENQSLTSSAIELYNARMAAEKTGLALKEIQEETYLNTVKMFFQILEMIDSQDLLKEKITLSQEKLTESIEKRDTGLVGDLDVLKARIELTEYEKQLSESEGQLVLAKEKFSHFIGADKDVSCVFSSVLEEKLRERVERLLTEEIEEKILLSQNELRQAQWVINEKSLQLSRKKEDLSPSWLLTIGYDSIGYDSERSVSGAMSPAQLQAKVGFSYNLFDAGRAELSMQAAKMELERARGNFRNLKETIRFDLFYQRETLRGWLSSLNLWKLKQDEIKLSSQLAEEQFALGVIGSQQLREVRLQEIEMENNFQSALHNLLTSYISYGTLLEIELDINEVIGK